MRQTIVAVLSGAVAIIAFGAYPTGPTGVATPAVTLALPKPAARPLRTPGSSFVPNLGQWAHPGKFVWRQGPRVLFLEDRGWTIDLAMAGSEAGDRALALRMSFAGQSESADLVGERRLPGQHDYFLGADAATWRTGVPRYASVRYQSLYPGIDLRVGGGGGLPEWELQLDVGADLSELDVQVQGVDSLWITVAGVLVMETEFGPLAQTAPRAWQFDQAGRRQWIDCWFTLQGVDRFGLAAVGWDGGSPLTIVSDLPWSTLLAGKDFDLITALSVDPSGVVTVAGTTRSVDFPTTPGAYDASYNLTRDVFVSRLDRHRVGVAQLVYSSYLGGSGGEGAKAIAVDRRGVITLSGTTSSSDFPRTGNAFDSSFNGSTDVFVSRLDPQQTGSAQLTYSTYLGGRLTDTVEAVEVDAGGALTMVGWTSSTDFPLAGKAFDRSHNGASDAFVSRLDPSRPAATQLSYSTYLGASGADIATGLGFDSRGVLTVVGNTDSVNFPVTRDAFDATRNGGSDFFVSRLDLRRSGTAQLVYSSYLGGLADEFFAKASVDATGLITLAGSTWSPDFPTTPDAYARVHAGRADLCISRLDPSRPPAAQLIYSTFLAGRDNDYLYGLQVAGDGVVTVAGSTWSADYPTTADAYSAIYGGNHDGFVSRLHPGLVGSAQLRNSTYLGGSQSDLIYALAVDESGTALVAGDTASSDFPTSSGAYDRVFRGNHDGFVSRLDLGVAMFADRHAISLRQASTQQLTVQAGKRHAKLSYWIFGSLGTSPGIDLLGVHLPLNPDPYTELAMVLVNSPALANFRGTLDDTGAALATFNLPAGLPPLPEITLYHAYLVYDSQGRFYMASNAVPLRLQN